jgi:hypothetical protein
VASHLVTSGLISAEIAGGEPGDFSSSGSCVCFLYFTTLCFCMRLREKIAFSLMGFRLAICLQQLQRCFSLRLWAPVHCPGSDTQTHLHTSRASYSRWRSGKRFISCSLGQVITLLISVCNLNMRDFVLFSS